MPNLVHQSCGTLAIYQAIHSMDGWRSTTTGSKLRCCHGQFFSPQGFQLGTLGGSTRLDAIRFGSSLLVWGAAVRTVVVWHLTWSVNSVTHLWGYRNYETSDSSRNNAIVALLNSGEGWHNNHHADPRSARHGHKWWELDVAWLTIRLLKLLGLASNISLPSPQLLASRLSSPPS